MKQIFVFGSNTQGRHGKGAALEAVQKHGAINGQAEGLQGNSYAIITKELRKERKPYSIDAIKLGVRRFVDFAKAHPELTFKVTPIGCGLAGFAVATIAPLFDGSPSNVILPKEFLSHSANGRLH